MLKFEDYEVCKYEFKDFSEWRKNGLIPVKNSYGLFGALDKSGREVIPCIYKKLERIQDGLIAVKGRNDLYGIIDMENNEIVPCKYKSIGEFSEGLARVEDEYENYGFIDRGGLEVIPCKFYNLENFNSGLARGFVSITSETFFIDKSGNKVIKISPFTSASNFSNGYARIYDLDYGYRYIDTFGNEVLTGKYEYVSQFYNGFAVVENNHRLCGLINTKLEEVLPCQYIDISNFSDELIVVQSPKGYGYFNKQGENVIPCKYAFARDFNDGAAKIVTKDRKKYFIDKQGKMITPYEYRYFDERKNSTVDYSTEFRDFSDDVIVINDEPGTFKIIDIAGKVLGSGTYNRVYPFHNGFARVRSDEGKYGYIDKSGNTVIPCIYDKAQDFEDGLALVTKDNDTYFINGLGQIALTNRVEYNSVLKLADSIIHLRADSKEELNRKKLSVLSLVKTDILASLVVTESEIMGDMFDEGHPEVSEKTL